MLDARIVSYDAQAIALLVSSLGAERGGVRPFGARAWSAIDRRLRDQGLSPGDLLGAGFVGVRRIAQDAEERERMEGLLARAGQLAFELDRLASRGIWLLSRADEGYPQRLIERLGDDAPPVLFGAGERSLLDGGGIAIVGSRDVDADGSDFARRLAVAAAAAGTPVVSGGARGVDAIAMEAARSAGGAVVGVLPEGVERRLRDAASRGALADGRSVLLSPYHPSAPFSVGAAMGRNHLIHALADVAVIVSSSAGTGGTWAGAVAAIEAAWVPVLVRSASGMPAGNGELIARGAAAIRPDQLPDAVTPEELIALATPAARSAPADGDIVSRTFEQQRLFPGD